MSKGRILFIDAYDSFANNIIALLKLDLLVSVESIKIDDSRFVLNDDAFHEFLRGFDAVVAGPGPGHPGTPSDVGSIGKLWGLPDGHLIPVLGICLGFQSMALAFGGAIESLREPRHGMVTPVLHCGRDIFQIAGDIEATQYHSLHVTVGSPPERLAIKDLWNPSKSSKELVPLAWDLSDEKNGPVLMSARHCHKPFWGVQFHPESICTNKAGQQLISNWWKHACAWYSAHGRCTVSDRSSRSAKQELPSIIDHPVRGLTENAVLWKRFQLTNGVNILDISDGFRTECDQHQPILLESGLRDGKPVNAETGRYSIIGLPDKETIHIRYSVASQKLSLSTATCTIASWKATVSDAFTFLESFVERYKAVGGPAGVPFWGGLVGFVSYEAGLESIDVQSTAAKNERPDLWFVFVQRSIVLEHNTGLVYVQSVSENDSDWVASMERRLNEIQRADGHDSSSSSHAGIAGAGVYGPSKKAYCGKVRRCQDHLRAGSSYELCLTDTTLLSNNTDPWQLYLRLRHINPAPFGAYFTASAGPTGIDSSVQVLHLLSSSPERFLSWSRDGRCQFRPIKGTVKKGLEMTREKAERILNSPKERAENLMIVDLIRHDLNGVARYVHNVAPAWPLHLSGLSSANMQQCAQR